MNNENGSGKGQTNGDFDPNSPDGDVIRAITNYRDESETAKRDRSLQNLENFDTYHLREDFSYKKKGQSKEFLPKVFMAVEQITSFIQQGIADLGSEWYDLEIEPGVTDPKILREDIKKLLDRQLEKAEFYVGISDSLKHGLLASLMIAKVHGRWVTKPKFTAKSGVDKNGQRGITLLKTKDKVWQLCIDIISQKDWFPDPTGRNLYCIQESEVDLHEILAMVKSKDNPSGIYDAEAVAQLTGDMLDMEKDAIGVRESGQNVTMSSYRHRVQISECWGTIINSKGRVIHENVVCTLARGKWLIQKPTPNPFWHGKWPFIAAPIVRVPHSVWGKALMDGPTKLNRAMNETFNLSLDSGLSAVFGVRQLRSDWLSDPSVVDDGITPGMTLEVSSSCPPGAKVMERVDTGVELQSGLTMYNMINTEHQQASMTNDLRMGILPPRQVKATEVVESSQAITGMLNGVAKMLETQFINKVLELSWMTCAQHLDDFNQDEVKKILGPQKAAMISQMSREERFAETVNGMTFRVFGITNILNKQKDFRRITSLLQTIASDPILVEEFAKKYDFGNLMEEILKALDIDKDKLKIRDEDKLVGASIAQPQAPGLPGAPSQAMAQPPDMQSQIPQVASEASGSIAVPNFPPSRAKQVLNQ